MYPSKWIFFNQMRKVFVRHQKWCPLSKYKHYHSFSFMCKCSSSLFHEHIFGPDPRHNFCFFLYLGRQALYLSGIYYRSLRQLNCLKQRMAFFSVWFRRRGWLLWVHELPHVSPSRTRPCRSMWLCFREPRSQDYYRHQACVPIKPYWRPIVLCWPNQYSYQEFLVLLR